uniref:Dynein regulatory complex subunit 7 n=1 Tax=Seriola lalandi dorsalis TaxID=1841481 RepID=A0A3B4XAS7_SERLL
HLLLFSKMETVLESDREEQLKSGETQEEEEKQDDRELEGALGNIHVSALDEAYPKVYRINSPDEIRLLAIADNFQRQYSHLYPDRKPLLLCPLNECGVKKFVSTTLRPTPTIFPELFTWEGSASFVANFLSLEPLEPPVDPPSYLFSSTSVLQSQRATCFEFATMLCSLLLGADYDAYCVSGYAVKDMCLLDQSLQDCPLLDTKVKVKQESQHNKYTVKPVRELKSHFLTQQEKKKQEAEAALLQKQKLQEESEQRTADPLRGLRVHCWVLVLSGSRSVQKNFFIDPLTGISYSTDHENFLGIESVWNNLNYYVNMQDCRNGCADMMYDLEDLNMWEPVLFGATSKKQLILDVLKEKETKMLSKINKDEEVCMCVSLCVCSYLETRWPGGQKVTRYRKAKVEKFTAYLRPDGLVTRLMTYKDLDCTEVAMVKEWYQHRNDHLEEREVNKVDSFTTERFKRGRPFYLLCKSDFYAMHEMGFSNTRIDNVVRRVVSPGEMTEIFEDRADFLHYRHVVFDRHIQISEPHVVERFHRDRAKPANEDVAERVFLPSQRRIEVTYHLEDHRFIPSKRSFIKPRESTEQKKAEEFTFDLVSSFQVDPSEKPLKIHTLYEMLVALMRDEKMVAAQIEQSLDETQRFTQHLPRFKQTKHFLLLQERQALEEQRWLQEREKDILAVILIQLDKAGTLSAEDAKQLHQECLTTFKQKLLEHADLIQERYEKVTQELQKKQQWYQENQLSMTQTEEADYHSFCSEKTLQIHVTKKRLSMHKEAAPQKYLAFDQKLRRDPRLAPHLSN